MGNNFRFRRTFIYGEVHLLFYSRKTVYICGPDCYGMGSLRKIFQIKIVIPESSSLPRLIITIIKFQRYRCYSVIIKCISDNIQITGNDHPLCGICNMDRCQIRFGTDKDIIGARGGCISRGINTFYNDIVLPVRKS